MVETKVERASHGHPVGQDTLYKAMGGLTGFSSMLEGYERLDSSGIGKICLLQKFAFVSIEPGEVEGNGEDGS